MNKCMYSTNLAPNALLLVKSNAWAKTKTSATGAQHKIHFRTRTFTEKNEIRNKKSVKRNVYS